MTSFGVFFGAARSMKLPVSSWYPKVLMGGASGNDGFCSEESSTIPSASPEPMIPLKSPRLEIAASSSPESSASASALEAPE